MPSYQQTRFSFGFSDVGKVTKALCITLVVVSALGAMTQRKFGVGSSELIFMPAALVRLQLWRVITYAFAVTTPFGLIIGALVLFLFGSYFERRWGSRDFLRFFLLSSVGAVILAAPLSVLITWVTPITDPGVASGPTAAIDALLVAMAMTSPESNVLFGFVLPMRAKTIIYVMLGIHLIWGIMAGVATPSVTLGGLAMGYLLVSGNWRPGRMIALIKLTVLRRRRRGLYVVPPPDKTLH